MRDDFAKVLVERPRLGHERSFGEQRHRKNFKDNELYFGGREPMKKRYDSYSDRKQFNEHLNPLRGWLRSVVGKPWDKSYSELRKKFDARSTINNHILEHLWWYVEKDAVLQDGKVVVLNTYSHEYEPISNSTSEYYICPKDGTLKRSNKKSFKTIRRDRDSARAEAEARVFRVLDSTHHLHLMNGVWFVFEIKELPPSTVTYVKPMHYGTGPQLFHRGWRSRGKMVPWEDLNQVERKIHGNQRVTGIVTDLLSGEDIHRDGAKSSKAGAGLYYCSKRSASHKELKAAGLARAANDDSIRRAA